MILMMAHTFAPNDLLLGRSSATVPQEPFTSARNPRHQAKFVQKIVDSFWRKSRRDLFAALLFSEKWMTGKRDVRVDDLVVVTDTN